MSDSEAWARRALEEANTILEPGDKTWRSQLADLLIWAAEVAMIWWLARTILKPFSG